VSLLARLGDKPSFLKLCRFAMVGMASTAIYAGTTFLSVHAWGLSPLVGQAVGLALSTLWSYFGHHAFTFGADGRHGAYLPRFLGQAAFTSLLSTAFIHVTAIWRLSYLWGVAATVVVAPVINFLLMQFWVFRAGVAARPEVNANGMGR
jgi:putative flippase GtrA